MTNVNESSCDLREPVWLSNSATIEDRNLLPVSAVRYGPHKYELYNANITIGPLQCHPAAEEETFNAKVEFQGLEEKVNEIVSKELGYKLEEAREQLKISIWFDAFRTSVDFENTSGPRKTITYTGLRESSGSGMDINTGVFTAPLAAIYEFHYEAEYYPGSFVARARIFFSIKGGLIFSLKHRTRSQIITFY